MRPLGVVGMSKLEQQQALPRGGIFDRIPVNKAKPVNKPKLTTLPVNTTAGVNTDIDWAKLEKRRTYMRAYMAKKRAK